MRQDETNLDLYADDSQPYLSSKTSKYGHLVVVPKIFETGVSFSYQASLHSCVLASDLIYLLKSISSSQ